MKTMLLIKRAGAVALAIVLCGCASSAKKGKDFSPYAPMGIVSVVSNYDINWEGERTFEKQSILSGLVRQTLGTKNDESKVRISRADTLINEADSLLREIIAGAEIFRLADKERTVNTAAYAGAQNARLPSSPAMITADAYKPLDYKDKQFAAAISSEAGIQSALYVTFTFNKIMISGIGKNGYCRAKVLMNIRLANPQGKTIYRKQFESYSEDKTEVKSEYYSHDALMDLFKEAIAAACYHFVWDYTGTPPGA